MIKNEMLALLKLGRSSDWNNYRQRNPKWTPDLSGMDLSSINLIPDDKPPFDLSKANLCGCKMPTTSFVNYGGKSVIVKDAVVNIKTESHSLDLVKAGAIFVSESEQLSPRNNPIVFISYAWANDNVVLAIDTWLQLKGLITKIDKRDFFAGSRIRDEILRVMAECNIILIFYSKQYKGKPWPEFEQELANDLEMEAKKKGNLPPLIIYIMIDDSYIPSITESNKIHIMAKGKRFELVCEEVYHNILRLPKKTEPIDLSKWSDYTF
jgi:hypothetical protein